jgi:hypothetical protein
VNTSVPHHDAVQPLRPLDCWNTAMADSGQLQRWTHPARRGLAGRYHGPLRRAAEAAISCFGIIAQVWKIDPRSLPYSLVLPKKPVSEAPWGAAHRAPSPIVMTILPICASLCMYACASPIRAHGNVRSSTGLRAPVAKAPSRCAANRSLQTSASSGVGVRRLLEAGTRSGPPTHQNRCR